VSELSRELGKRARVRRAFRRLSPLLIFGMAAWGACIPGCGGSVEDEGPVDAASSFGDDGGSEGAVRFRTTVPAGTNISTLAYTLVNGPFAYQGTADVGPGGSVDHVIQGVAPSGDYSLTLVGSSGDGSASCNGSAGTSMPNDSTGAPFAVTALGTTWIDVQLICIAAVDVGPVMTQMPPACCAVPSTLDANPQRISILPGNRSILSSSVSGCGSDGGAKLDCAWSVVNGDGIVADAYTDGAGKFYAAFTCPHHAETDTVEISCTDGPLPEGGACARSTGTVDIVCQAPAADASAAVDASAE
jgi:hypothetical protein